MQNIPYETFAPHVPLAPIHANVPQVVCDVILSLNADTAPAEKLRNTILYLQQMLRHKT